MFLPREAWSVTRIDEDGCILADDVGSLRPVFRVQAYGWTLREVIAKLVLVHNKYL